MGESRPGLCCCGPSASPTSPIAFNYRHQARHHSLSCLPLGHSSPSYTNSQPLMPSVQADAGFLYRGSISYCAAQTHTAPCWCCPPPIHRTSGSRLGNNQINHIHRAPGACGRLHPDLRVHLAARMSTINMRPCVCHLVPMKSSRHSLGHMRHIDGNGVRILRIAARKASRGSKFVCYRGFLTENGM